MRKLLVLCLLFCAYWVQGQSLEEWYRSSNPRERVFTYIGFLGACYFTQAMLNGVPLEARTYPYQQITSAYTDILQTRPLQLHDLIEDIMRSRDFYEYRKRDMWYILFQLSKELATNPNLRESYKGGKYDY